MSQLPKLALGTWLMGGDKDPNPANDDQADIEVIKNAIESGITLIDTAQNYAAGKSEELVGQAIKQYPRQDIQILTKQRSADLSYDGVITGCQDSLRRLGTNYIDYFICHAPNPSFELVDFFKATNQLYRDGLIRNVGVSNFGPKSLQIAIENSDIPISLNQVSFSLLDDDIISTGTYDFCLQNNIPIQAYQVFKNLDESIGVKATISQLAEKHSVSSHQIALAYLNSYDNLHFTIRASSREHWSDIKNALSLKLDATDLEKLRSLHHGRTRETRRLLQL